MPYADKQDVSDSLNGRGDNRQQPPIHRRPDVSIRDIGFYWLIAEYDPVKKLEFGYAKLNDDALAEWGLSTSLSYAGTEQCSIHNGNCTSSPAQTISLDANWSPTVFIKGDRRTVIHAKS